jgi:hypothetical protein
MSKIFQPKPSERATTSLTHRNPCAPSRTRFVATHVYAAAAKKLQHSPPAILPNVVVVAQIRVQYSMQPIMIRVKTRNGDCIRHAPATTHMAFEQIAWSAGWNLAARDVVSG